MTVVVDRPKTISGRRVFNGRTWLVSTYCVYAINPQIRKSFRAYASKSFNAYVSVVFEPFET